MIKKATKSKTIIFATLLAALGVIQTSMDAFTPFLTPHVMGIFTMLVGVAVAVLRVITTTGLKDK